MSTVCDNAQNTRTLVARGLSRVSAWGGSRDVSPMRPARESRVPSVRAVYPLNRSIPSMPLSRGSMSLSLGSVKRTHCVAFPSHQIIPNAVDVAALGAAPVG